MSKETRSFEAETKQILDLMIHSIYTHKEIFLRELISNASDAIDKVRFESLTNAALLKGDTEFKIEIILDKAKRTITIKDNGIGMTYDEVVTNIGTIAKSGTKSFLEALKANKEGGSVDLIGQFGVGFYSSFMVSKNVTMLTRSPLDEKGVRWESTGDGTYAIEAIDREARGTEVILSLRDKEEGDDSDYTDPYTIQSLVKKYSDYIQYPILMDMPVYDEKDKDKHEIKTLNSMVPLWKRNKNDIKKEEYAEFFKLHFHEFADPVEIIHTKAEGTLEYTALLFIPSKAPFNLHFAEFEKGIQLYSKNVFIMDRCKELVPDYLRFVRGLIDSPDFSLNISREILQHTRQLATIGKNIEKKVLESLADLLIKERTKYEDFWKEFGEAIKTGLYSDPGAKDKLKDLIMFESSNGGMATFKEYVSRMKDGQKEIYFGVGMSREQIEKLPQMEAVRDKGYEVLYFTQRVDEFMAMHITDYDGKKLHSISKGDIESLEKDDKKKEAGEKEYKDILAAIKEALGDKVSEVRVSKRLKSSPVCLVAADDGVSFAMEQMMAQTQMKKMMPHAKKILELNPDHALFQVLKDEFTANKISARLKDYSLLLYEQGLLIEGYALDDAADFSRRMADIMVRAK